MKNQNNIKSINSGLIMQELVYLTHFLGSFSLGYFLMRLAFPDAQQFGIEKKLGMGLLIGVIVSFPGFLAAIIFQKDYFYALTFVIFILLIISFFIKRKMYFEEDLAPLIEEKRKIELPKKVLTKEELGEERDIEEVLKNQQINLENQKEQIFKQKNTNVIGDLREIISSPSEDEKEKQKKEMLEKLRNEAKKISPNKVNQEKKENKIKENGKESNAKKDSQENEEDLENIFDLD